METQINIACMSRNVLNQDYQMNCLQLESFLQQLCSCARHFAIIALSLGEDSKLPVPLWYIWLAFLSNLLSYKLLLYQLECIHTL